MATEEERAAAVAAVAEILTGLAGRAPGSVLRAEDWNALVDAVGRVVRLPAAEPAGGVGSGGEPGEVVPGSVGFAALSPEVQNLLRSGPFADPRQAGGQLAVDRRLASVTERVAALETRLDGLLGVLTRAETALSRQGNDLRLVDQRVAGTTGLKAEVGDLRTLLGSVRTDVTQVLELRQQIDGLDLSQLRAEVEGLGAFREAWRDGQGEVVGFAGFSRRLAEIADTAVSDAELGPILDARLENFVVDTGPIRTAVTNDLVAELAATKAEVRRDSAVTVAEALTELRGRLEGEVARVVGTRVGDLENRLGDVARAAADERLAAAREELRVEVVRIVDERIDQRGPRVSPQDLAELDARLTARVDAVESENLTRADVETLLGTVRTDLGGRVDTVAAGVEANRRGQAELGAALRRERSDAAAAESRRLEGLLDAQARRESVERAGAVDAAAQRVSADLGGRIDATAQALRAERDAAVAAAVEARTADLSGRLEARIRVVAQDAVAAVESDVFDLRSQFRGLDGRLVELDRVVKRGPGGGGPLRPTPPGGGG